MMSSFSLYPPSAWDRDGGPASLEPEPLSVGDLTAMVKGMIESGFDRVLVRGEVSNLSRPRSGHVYFKLKDDRATLAAVLWKSAAQTVRFDLTDGLEVTASGGLSVYPAKGEYQLVVRKIEPVGVGPLELAFRQMAERLRAAGLFDVARKRPIPAYPRRIVLVTSPTGAAVRDFLRVMAVRWPLAELLIAPAKMQGIDSENEVAAAIELANRVNGAELIVLARGGGSIEDLWSFNTEVVARAIFDSALPVVTGVGHEVDVTIADFVADLRANTPTDAAVRVSPDRVELLDQLQARADRLAGSLRRELALADQGVRRRAERLGAAISRRTAAAGYELQSRGDRMRSALRGRVERAAGRLAALGDRLPSAWALGQERRRSEVARRAERLEALSPLGVLARGYSLTLAEDGSVVRRADQVRPGDRLRIRLSAGALLSRVEGVLLSELSERGPHGPNHDG